ncbi:hypothetical protein Pelo_6875 [Pelomyxa schiedti]|nr:hypothetical protein Pelo_6875 [Pelomyxa schiedti]
MSLHSTTSTTTTSASGTAAFMTAETGTEDKPAEKQGLKKAAGTAEAAVPAEFALLPPVCNVQGFIPLGIHTESAESREEFKQPPRGSVRLWARDQFMAFLGLSIKRCRRITKSGVFTTYGFEHTRLHRTAISLVGRLVWDYACVGLTRRYCIGFQGEFSTVDELLVTFGVSPLVMGVTEGLRWWVGFDFAHRKRAYNQRRCAHVDSNGKVSVWRPESNKGAGVGHVRSSIMDHLYARSFSVFSFGWKAHSNRKWHVLLSNHNTITIVDLVGNRTKEEKASTDAENADICSVAIPIPREHIRYHKHLFFNPTEPDEAVIYVHDTQDSDVQLFIVDLAQTYSLRVFTCTTKVIRLDVPYEGCTNPWGSPILTKPNGERCFLFLDARPAVPNTVPVLEAVPPNYSEPGTTVIVHKLVAPPAILPVISPLSKSLFCISTSDGSHTLWDYSDITSGIIAPIFSGNQRDTTVVAETGLLFQQVHDPAANTITIQVTCPMSHLLTLQVQDTCSGITYGPATATSFLL